MVDIYDFNNIFIKSIVQYFYIFSRSNPVVLEFYYFAASSHSNNNQAVKNICKLTAIKKTYRLNLPFKTNNIYLKALHRPQKEAITYVYALINHQTYLKFEKF